MNEEINNLKGIFANVNDDMLLRDCGNLYAENKQLQQENQQLKRNCNIGNENLNFYREEYKKIKSVLDEIREYINEHSIYFATKEKVGNYFANCSCDELLQILDKVKE